MKHAIIQNAINIIIGEVEALQRIDARCEGTTNWHAKYLQEHKDHKDNLNSAHVELSQMRVKLGAVESERYSWAQRFKGLEADMRGMETMLTEEREHHTRTLALGKMWEQKTNERTNTIGQQDEEIARLKDALAKMGTVKELIEALRSVI